MIFISPVSVNSDSRRTLTNLLRRDIKDINVCEAKKGCILGNHYHKLTDEYFYIVRGTCLVHSGDNSQIVNKRSLFLIEPNIKHSVECLTDVTYLTFLSEPFNESNPDIYK